MQVNRKLAPSNTEASSDMKSKLENLFGTNTDEVTSENGDMDQSIQTQLN